MTRGNTRNLRPGIGIHVGDMIVVGNENAEPGVGEIAELRDGGVVVVRVFPGGIDENRFRLGDRSSTS